ncbi:uncharacterized protein [Nicotiana tomentosiformis]|uniref:uncharacterized protein n=1 Tax=Nicotiana tomentosiformis TaxID=4098 RepID=UPI00388C5C8B
MAKTSKLIPQQAAPSSSHPATGTEATVTEVVVLETVAPEVKTEELIPKGDNDASLPVDPSVTGQPGAATRKKKKKRKRKSSGSPGPEVKPKKRAASWARKPKKTTNSRVPDSNSLLHLRDESEKDDIFVSHGSTLVGEQAAAEGKSHEADLSPTREAKMEMGAETSQEDTSSLKEEIGVIDIMETPSYTESMLEDAQAGKERSSEGASVLHHRASSNTASKLASSSSSLRSSPSGTLKDLQEELDRTQNEASALRQLSSAVTERDALSREYEAVKSKLDITSTDADEMVAQYKVDVEAAEVRLKAKVEYMKHLSRRETLKEIHTQGFDLSAEIEEAKKSEAEAKKLCEPKGGEVSKGL